MKYLLWIPIGLVCGAALGLILPVGVCMLIVWKEGARANGIGTPFALLTIITVPAGALFGAYAGAHRARTGNWKRAFSDSPNPDALTVLKVAALKRGFRDFNDKLASMPADEANLAKQDYLRNLMDDYESTEFNYRLLGIWIVASIAIPIAAIFPVSMVLRHVMVMKQMRGHIRDAMSLWSENS